MPLHVGAPGHLLTLPYHSRGMDASPETVNAVHQALRGGRTVDRIGLPKRTYRWTRNRLTTAELAVLEGLLLGLYGKPPYLLFDPERVNQLTANQCSGGDALRDLTGFYADAVTPMDLTVVTSEAWVGQASVRVDYPHTLPDLHTLIGFGNFLGDVAPSDPFALGATPVRPGVEYTASMYAIDAAGAGASVEVLVRCYKADGARIATTFASTATALDDAAWTRLSVTFTAPGNVAFVGLEVRKTTSAATGALSVAIDGAQLQTGPAATAWAPATGVPWVAPMSLTDTYPRTGRHDSEIAFMEL